MGSKRPKGYAAWDPAPETQAVLMDVRQVLREYQAHLPLTVRQIFYRLVGQYGYDKTERAYARLCEYMVRARRAQLIDFEAIRDDGTTHHEFWRYADPADFWRQVHDQAEGYVRDKMAGQPVAIELWCEAAGMVPQLERVANRYSVPVYSTGGFSSVTVTYEIAQRALGRDRPTVFLHAGDWDPSGESIFQAMTDDAQQFLYNRLVWQLQGSSDPEAQALAAKHWPGNALYPVGQLPASMPDLRPVRVALTEEQVLDYDLPTAPPKASDSRSASWGTDTCQLEAMPPDQLADVIAEAIEAVLDLDMLEDVRDKEREEREWIQDRVGEIIAAEGMDE